jgi:hypothetical protein
MALNPRNQDFRSGGQLQITASSDGKYYSAYPSGDAPEVIPTYTPFMAFDFSGTLAASASQAEFSPEPDQSPENSLIYSDDVTGPFDEAVVAKQSIEAQGNRSFGGTFLDGSGLAITDNSDTWIRIMHYFPAAFCAGYDLGTGEASDGYGSTKWLRYGFGVSGDRITHQLDGFLNSACGTAMNQGHTSFEITGGSDANTPSPATIPRDQWVAIQYHIHWAEDATGFVRAWLGDTYLGEVGSIITKPAGDDALNDLTLGNYWNGASHQANTWYIQSVIGTQQTPNTLDSGGRAYISPLTKVSDFV